MKAGDCEYETILGYTTRSCFKKITKRSVLLFHIVLKIILFHEDPPLQIHSPQFWSGHCVMVPWLHHTDSQFFALLINLGLTCNVFTSPSPNLSIQAKIKAHASCTVFTTVSPGTHSLCFLACIPSYSHYLLFNLFLFILFKWFPIP